MRHTKGPWVVDGPTTNSESYDCYYVRTEDGTIVAETDAWNGTANDGGDAHLISAAPDLLEALLSVVEDYDLGVDVPGYISDAIAKAESRPTPKG